jgi:hypothetical protein
MSSLQSLLKRKGVIFLMLVYSSLFAFSNILVESLFDFNDSNMPQQQTLRAAFNKLQELEKGKVIINTLHRLIIKVKVKIKIKDGKTIATDLDEQKNPYIKGIHELENNQTCCLLGAWDEEVGGYKVGLGEIPPHIILGHELLHLIDGLQNPDAFVNHSRSFEQWINDNQGNTLIEELVKMPYFKEIYMPPKEVNTYEELFVYFGTNASREIEIPTENHLLWEAGIGLRIGYDPKRTSFFISKEAAKYLIELCDCNIPREDDIFILGVPEENIKFDRTCALQNSPSFFRNRGMYRAQSLSNQMLSLEDFFKCFPWQEKQKEQFDEQRRQFNEQKQSLVKKQRLSKQKQLPRKQEPSEEQERQFSEQKRQFEEQRRQFSKQQKQPEDFLKAYQEVAQEIDGMCQKLPFPIVQQDITLAYYYGSKVIVKINEPVPLLEQEAPKISFRLDSSRLHKILFRPNQSEIVYTLGWVKEWIKDAPPRQVTIFLNDQLWNTIDFSSSINTYELPFGKITFDFVINAPFLSMNSFPELTPKDPKTVLGLIRYEQFYNNHHKLLLQVGDGTSLEETIRLHKQIYNMPVDEGSITRDRETSHSRISWGEVLQVANISATFVPPEGSDFFARDAGKREKIKAALSARSKMNEADSIANTSKISLRLYQCDSQGKEELLAPFLFLHGRPESPIVEVVQDVTSTPNVYFLVVDTNSLPSSPKVQTPKRPQVPGDRSVTPKRKPDRGSPSSPRSPTKPKPPGKSKP